MSDHPGRLVLLGDPVAHSLSPIFQNAALRAAGISLNYEAVRVRAADLAQTMRDLVRERGAGNVTIPHKLAAFGLCTRKTEVAKRAAAVNTFWTEAGELAGDNTDVGGFDSAARSLLGDATDGARVVLLGAGGGAAAVLAAVEQWPKASVAIIARNPLRARELASRFADVARVEMALERGVAGATLIVNSTPVGLRDDTMPYELSLLAPETAVFDLVYRKGGTAWVKAARERGLRAADGLQMLLEQGALSFQRWFGVQPDREAMARSLA